MNTSQWDQLWINGQACCCSQQHGAKNIVNAALAIKNDTIAWIGPAAELTDQPARLAKQIINLNNHIITPGLIDCHTHLIFAGSRANEWNMRLQGKNYTDIAKNGGGILATVAATRAASSNELYQLALQRLNEYIKQGVTTLEIKSGYGLNHIDELKILQVIHKLKQTTPLSIYATYLGAHTKPPEYNSSDEYITDICQTTLPEIQQRQLADAVDIFCEDIAFSPKQMEKLFECAISLGFAIKCHAEQLNSLNASSIAAKYNALSADHLEYATLQNIIDLANSNTTAVLLPGAFYHLQQQKKPAIELFKEYNVPIAIASDFNPGSSPCNNLLLIMHMACTLFNMTVEDVFMSVTLHAARALGLAHSYGSLEVGKKADCVIWESSTLADIIYNFGQQPGNITLKHGIAISNTLQQTLQKSSNVS